LGRFGRFLGAKSCAFSHFFPVTSPLREDVGVLGTTPHLLNVSVHPRRTLCAVVVERLVGIFILAVHALDLSEIVAAWSMLFPLTVVEGPLVVL